MAYVLQAFAANQSVFSFPTQSPAILECNCPEEEEEEEEEEESQTSEFAWFPGLASFSTGKEVRGDFPRESGVRAPPPSLEPSLVSPRSTGGGADHEEHALRHGGGDVGRREGEEGRSCGVWP